MSLSKLHDIKKNTRYSAAHTPQAQRVISRQSISSPRGPSSSRHRRETSGRGIWYLTAILLIGLFFGLSVFFTHAQITITPVTQDTPLNERIIAYKKSISQDLTFDVMVVEGSISQTVTSQNKEVVEERAVGRVKLFNDHGSEAQPLRIDTRLIDEKGRIYKTKEAVTIPGKTLQDGQGIPGTVEVDIYADAAGEIYNEPQEMTLRLLGFQETNSPKFQTVYAQTLGPIEGGFTGERYVIPEEEKQAIIAGLQSQLTEDLMKKSEAQVPEHSVFPKNLSTLVDVSTREEIQEDGTIVLILEGKLFNVLFNIVEFERFLLQNSVVGVNQEEAYIRNIKTLNITYVDQQLQTLDIENFETLAIQIDDVLEIVSIVDTEVVNFELVGQKKKDFQNIISQHPGVAYVEYKISPFWRPRFPDNSEDIEVVLTIQKETQIDQ